MQSGRLLTNRPPLSESRTDRAMCGTLSHCQSNLLILSLEQSFVPASCAGRHDLVDSLRNTMAVPASPAFYSLACCQFLLHRSRQLSRAYGTASSEMAD